MNSSWVSSIARFLCLQSISFVSIVLIVTTSGIYSRQSQAESLGNAVRNDLIVGDIRSVISALNFSSEFGFLHIKGLNHQSSVIFEVGEKDLTEKRTVIKYQYPISASVPSNSDSYVGTILFYFDLVPFIRTSILVWFLFGVMSLPLLWLEKNRIEKSIRREFVVREAEIRHSLAEQVAHDIRSPLSVLNLIKDRIMEDAEARDIYLSAVNRINDIAKDLLVSGSKSSAEALDDISTSMLTKINFLIEEMHIEKSLLWRNSKDVVFELDLQTSEGIFVVADPSKLKRILSNVLNNAFEALVDGKGHVTLGTRAGLSGTVIYVLDTGKGMSLDIIETLGNTRVSIGKSSGFGLGLYGAKKTIADWNGDMDIKSKPNEGTLVEISLRNG